MTRREINGLGESTSSIPSSELEVDWSYGEFQSHAAWNIRALDGRLFLLGVRPPSVCVLSRLNGEGWWLKSMSHTVMLYNDSLTAVTTATEKTIQVDKERSVIFTEWLHLNARHLVLQECFQQSYKALFYSEVSAVLTANGCWSSISRNKWLLPTARSTIGPSDSLDSLAGLKNRRTGTCAGFYEALCCRGMPMMMWIIDAAASVCEWRETCHPNLLDKTDPVGARGTVCL